MNTKLILTGLRISALAFAILKPMTAPGATPLVTTLPASGILSYQSTLNGQGYSSQGATAWFEYGLTPNYGNRAGNFIIPAGNTNFPPTAVSFNGSNQDATVFGFGIYAPTNEVTIEFWQLAVDAQEQSSFILNPDVATNRINSHDPWVDGYSYWDFGNIDTSGRLYAPDTGVIGSWNNIALVASQSGNYMSIYTNGVLLTTKSGMTPFQRYDADLLLAGGAEGINFFNGSLAEFRVWNKALDQATIQAWMGRPLNNTHPDWTNLVAYWPMNEGSGSVLIDQSGNAHNAALNNLPTWLERTNTAVATLVQGLAGATSYHYALVLNVGGVITMGQDATFTTPAVTDLTVSLPLTVLHAFSGTNGDGAFPYANLASSGGVLYGETYYGGTNGNGMIFAINTDGTGFTNLHTFAAYGTSGQIYTNADGLGPVGGLVLDGDTMYGTTYDGGPNGYGTVFSVKTDGSAFTNLYSFAGGTNGGDLYAGLIMSSNRLYGTTYYGGSNDDGVVFAINTDGSDFAILRSFDSTNDGAYLEDPLVVSGGTLYGTTYEGGTNSSGTVFGLNINGTGFSVLHAFTDGADGGYPEAGLIISGDTLYGTTVYGGTNSYGTIFSVQTNGSNFNTIHTFAGRADGAYPSAALTLAGSTLYGAAYEGGNNNEGTLFRLQTNGAGFMNLHSFYAPTDGAYLYFGPILLGDTLYGTTYEDGGAGVGTVFSLMLAPSLALTRAGSNVVLSWPTNEAGFSLQCGTNLTPPQVWTQVSLLPTVLGQQFAVTNAATSHRAFYRLGL
jgi:uncharacterized repeat protein (TIGR03803 family)